MGPSAKDVFKFDDRQTAIEMDRLQLSAIKVLK